MREVIMNIMENHKGKKNAIVRADLLLEIKADRIFQSYVPQSISDREMRATVAELPICACERGYYLPETAGDLIAFQKYLRAKALPLFSRYKRVQEAYPELVETYGQMELFGK